MQAGRYMYCGTCATAVCPNIIGCSLQILFMQPRTVADYLLGYMLQHGLLHPAGESETALLHTFHSKQEVYTAVRNISVQGFSLIHS